MTAAPELSVVVPVMNEVENAVPLLNEICAALRGKVAFEVLFVDDASSDGTVASLTAAKGQAPELRVLRHQRNSGQSRAVRSGVIAARGRLIATLDGDGQNDPADIPSLLDLWRRQENAGQGTLGLVAGQRRKREDSVMKKIASRVGNGTRQWLLQDGTRDTGCGLKLFSREAFLRLPYFDHIHRFIPALMLREGYRITHIDVNHRPRSHGVSKYGTLDRLLVSLADLRGVGGFGGGRVTLSAWTRFDHMYEYLIAAMTWENVWLLIGFAGQGLFMSRFIVQWWASEKARRSVVPVMFWYFSVGGGVVLLIYAIYKKDPVFISGQALGLIVYARNLYLIFAERSPAGSEEPPPPPQKSP